MEQNKVNQLIDTLLKQSNENKVKWKQMSSDTFKISTANASVAVAQSTVYESELRITSMYIYDKNGKMVDDEQVAIDYHLPICTDIERLYKSAKANALDSNGVIDALLSELDSNEFDDI